MNPKILGDKPKHNFDDNLADYVNQIFDNKPDEDILKECEEKKVILSTEAWPFNLGIPKASPFVLSQNDFIKAFNMVNSIMVSAADLYGWLKEADEKDIANLRNELKEKSLITSTRIIYSKDSRLSQVIPHFGSTFIQPQSSTVNIFYPEKSSNYFSNIWDAEGGSNFLQTLFQTNDPSHTIMLALNKLNYTIEDIEMDLPQQWQREKLSERIGSVTISLAKRENWKTHSKSFFAIQVDCQGWIDASEGYSRTVKYK